MFAVQKWHQTWCSFHPAFSTLPVSSTDNWQLITVFPFLPAFHPSAATPVRTAPRTPCCASPARWSADAPHAAAGSVQTPLQPSARPDRLSARRPAAVSAPSPAPRPDSPCCCSPPLSSPDRCPARAASPTSPSHARAFLSASAGRSPRASSRHQQRFSPAP